MTHWSFSFVGMFVNVTVLPGMRLQKRIGVANEALGALLE
jgi:hypothetical protein